MYTGKEEDEDATDDMDVVEGVVASSSKNW
jgi:hypothetical protein